MAHLLTFIRDTTLERHWHAFDNTLSNKSLPLNCYTVKSNSNIAILNLMAKLGSGFDIVSQGELERVLVAGGDAKKIVFSGVAKSEQEIQKSIRSWHQMFQCKKALLNFIA